jgi:putative pyruvate formate lyase activating enzyme
MTTRTPTYHVLYKSGELERRADRLEGMLAACTVCPHLCGNNRMAGELARCHAGALPIVSSFCRHFGEEPALTGTRGVGNIFFGNCTMRCIYCQNHEISAAWRTEQAHSVSIERLADIMLELQAEGAHAVGLVSPSHFVPQLVRALAIAAQRGLVLPLIYNTNAFDSLEVLHLLDGIVDIYLPDLKYADDDLGFRYSKVRGYTAVSRAAVREMHRQVGSTMTVDEDGLVQRGLIIRHLVLPNDIASSQETLRWIRDTLGNRVTLSIMSQYYPASEAERTELLDRRIRPSEYARVLELLDELGFEHGWIQEFESSQCYRPDFSSRATPFTDRPVPL